MDNPFFSDLHDALRAAGWKDEHDTSLPVPAQKIEDICQARDQALLLLTKAEDRWNDFVSATKTINEQILLVAPHAGVAYDPSELGKIISDKRAREEIQREKGETIAKTLADFHRRRIDGGAWRRLISSSALADLMDATAKKDFEACLGDPPPLTIENCFATFKQLLDDAGKMQCRGVVELFKTLNSIEYKSNDAFHIGTRIVVDYIVEESYAGRMRFIWGARQNALIDLERAICLILGEPVPSHQATIVRRLDSSGMDDGLYEDRVWKLRWYKKGTLHIYIKSATVRARLNEMIADHFGLQLGDGAGRPNAHDPQFKGKRRVRSTGIDKIDRNAFYTPPAVADELVAFSGLAECESKVLLEPSCGHGELMMAALRAGCHYMHGVENHLVSANACHQRMAKAFEAEGLTIERYNDKLLHVFRCDFETWIGPHVWNSNDQAMYSHVIMNPPFDHQLRHVVRAYEFLRPGRELRSGDVIEAGCLTSIMGANVLTGQDGDFVKFRAWLEAKGAMIERLPSGSFRPSGTDVETIMVKVPGPWAD